MEPEALGVTLLCGEPSCFLLGAEQYQGHSRSALCLGKAGNQPHLPDGPGVLWGSGLWVSYAGCFGVGNHMCV